MRGLDAQKLPTELHWRHHRPEGKTGVHNLPLTSKYVISIRNFTEIFGLFTVLLRVVRFRGYIYALFTDKG